VHSPDPDYDLKLLYVAQAQQQARQHPERIVFLYGDEFTYYRRASVAQGYAVCGSSQPRVELGHRANLFQRVAACLHLLTGQLLVMQTQRFTVKYFLRFLRQVEAAFPHAERIFIALDNWAVHFHPDILLALQTSTITLLRLPTYAPWTNPIEKVWLALNRQVLHLHPFGDDWTGLKAAVQAWFDRHRVASLSLLRAVGLYPY
jgi:transposase